VELPDFADSPIYLEKDASFKAEDEVRLILEANPSSKFARFRPGRFGAFPYIDSSHAPEPGPFIPKRADQILPIRRSGSARQPIRLPQDVLLSLCFT
jgi:hypothetical protein